MITNFEKIGKSTYQAIILDGCREKEVIIKKNVNTWLWDCTIDGVYQFSHTGLKWAKNWLSFLLTKQGV